VNLLTGKNTVGMLLSSILRVKPAVASGKARIANIERLRILSAFGVASFHIHDWFPRSLGVVGFIVFLLTFCIFVVNKPEPYAMAHLIKQKSGRLLKPWLFWSGIYGLLKLLKIVYMNVSFSEVFSPTMILTGTRIHLWFLPFAFFAALLLALIHRRIVNVSKSLTIITAILIGVVCVLVCSIIQSRIQPPKPLTQWTLGLPAIPLGFAIGRITLLRKAEERRNMYLVIVFSTTVACALFAWLGNGTWMGYGSTFAIRYCVSLAIVCSALHWKGNFGPISSKLASLSYGIYLIHPLVVGPFYQFGIAIQHPLILLFIVLFISLLITFILSKTPLRQFV